MTPQPILSVIIPCYNHGKYVIQCVESVLASSLSAQIEIIVINDGSTDNGYTHGVLETIKRENVKIIHQENQGLGKTRNKAIQMAKGEYILPVDADNYVTTTFLEKSIQLLDMDMTVDIVFPDRIIVSENGKETYDKVKEYDKNMSILYNYIDACAMYRRKVWEKVGGYDGDMPVMGLEDWDFWIRCSALNCKFHHLKGYYFYYRNLGNSMLKNAEKNYDTVYEYVLKKNAPTFVSLFKDIRHDYSYLRRKPLHYLLKSLFKK